MSSPEGLLLKQKTPTVTDLFNHFPFVIILAGQFALKQNDIKAVDPLFKMPLLDEVKEPFNRHQQKRLDLVIDLFRESMCHPKFIPITEELFDPTLPKVQDGLEKSGYFLCLLALGASAYDSRYTYEEYIASYKQQLIDIRKRIKFKPQLLTLEHISEAILLGRFKPLPFETQLKKQLLLNDQFRYDVSSFLATAPIFILANVDGVRKHHYRSQKYFAQIFDPVEEIKSTIQSDEERDRFDQAVNLLKQSINHPDFNQATASLNIESGHPYFYIHRLMTLLSLGAAVNNNNYSYSDYFFNYSSQLATKSALSGSNPSLELLSKNILDGSFNLLPFPGQ